MTQSTQHIDAHLAEHRPWLLSQARWRLGAERSAAEDVVQETLIAAWNGASTLRGEPTKGWLAGILRHKVADHWRKTPARDDETSIQCAPNDFADDGHWAEPSSNWGNPERILEAEGFWNILDLCSKILPVSMYRVFSLREIDGMPVADICQTLGLTESNCHVMLHRARLKLRGCVGSKWGKSA